MSSSLSSIALEQGNADLTILSTSLAKSKRITDKMATMLSSFDDRLARLEKSLVPIHADTGRLTRVSANLETVLRQIDGLLGHHDLVDRESPLINKGPSPGDLAPYKAALDRLLSASEALRRTDAKGQSATLTAMGALIDIGARQLVAVFTRWTKETSSSVDAGALVDQGKSFPTLSAFFLENAMPLFAYLSSLPEIGSSVTKDLEFAYADQRATYVQESLRQCAKEVLMDAAAFQSVGSRRRGLGRFLDVLFALAKSEHALLLAVFSNTSQEIRKNIYSAILPAALGTLYTTGQQLNTLIKQSLHSLVSLAFSSFGELSDRSGEFEEWIRNKASRRENELGELLHQFRGSCLRSIPEFISDTKTWGSKALTSAEISAVGVNSMTVNVVTFMKQLTDNQPTVEGFLTTLGAGNWGGPPPSISRSAGLPNLEFETPSLIQKYLNDVLITLTNSLDSRSLSFKSSGFSAIFLLNNIAFIRREVLSSQIGDLLGEGCEDSLNKKMRLFKSNYLEIWSPLVSSLLDAGSAGDTGNVLKNGISGAANALKNGGGKFQDTKERFVRFFDAFEEIERIHSVAKLDEGENELRERLKGEVERMILPTFSKYLSKHKNGDFSKNPSKYLKLDAEELSSRMAILFD